MNIVNMGKKIGKLQFGELDGFIIITQRGRVWLNLCNELTGVFTLICH